METEVDKHNRMPTKQNFTAWLRNQFRFQHRLSDSIEESAIGSGVARGNVAPSLYLCTWCACHPRILARAAEELPGRRKGRSAVPLSFVALTVATEMPNKRPAST